MENEEVMGGTSDPVDKLIDVDEDDDDLVEVELEDVPVTVGTQKRKAKRRKTSAVWAFFEMLPAKGDGDKPCCRCKKCGNKYVSPVQDGLKEIDGVVQKIRECIKYVKGSQGRKVKFFDSVKQMSLDGKKGLRQDVPTRWNSTFLMLESAIFYRRAFHHLELTDSNFKHCPIADEWNKAEKISTFLAVFYDATCVFSGTKYPTANLYFQQVFMVYLTLRQGSESEDEYVRRMAEQMLVKFEKYWSEFSIVLAIAVILDPRFKLQFVDFCYKKLYGVGGSYEYLKVREKLFALFGEYVSNVPTPSSTTNNRGKAVQDLQFKSFSKETMFVMKEFDCFESDDVVGQTQKTQLELYLEEPRMDRNAKLDILSFWKGNQFRYPELAAMVRDVLSIPISTVASESTFSVGGRVIDQFRSALKPDVVEALICSRDWLYGDKDLAESQLDDLTEDIMKMDINKENNDEPPSMGSNADMV
uniref:HAT C-terminal dimerisation domain-containing protein n=1 Tax=Fagus sylvatica TaxID=28930 RepID=A0A2N9E2D6_FAGSY